MMDLNFLVPFAVTCSIGALFFSAIAIRRGMINSRAIRILQSPMRQLNPTCPECGAFPDDDDGCRNIETCKYWYDAELKLWASRHDTYKELYGDGRPH